MSIPVDRFPDVAKIDYSQLRRQIRSGDIMLCSGTGMFSELIQKTTKSIWSHIAFILRLNAIDRIMVLESVESYGVRTVPLSSYVHNYDGTGKGYSGQVLIARHTKFNPDNIVNLSKFAVDLLGYHYDKQEIIRIASRIGLRAYGIDPAPVKIGQDRAYICSEYAYACYRSVGIEIQHDPEGFVTPADFAKTEAINAINFVNIEDQVK